MIVNIKENATLGKTFLNFDDGPSTYYLIDGEIIYPDLFNGYLDILSTILEIGNIRGGVLCVYAEIKNTGSADAANVKWKIVINRRVGPPILYEGTIPMFEAGGTKTVCTKDVEGPPIFGLGRISIEVTVGASGSELIEKEVAGFILLFFVLIW
jgi:hypothetical protein